MEGVLGQVNAVPGVIGSVLCDADGTVLVRALPPTFDVTILDEAAGVLADSAVGLDGTAGGVELFDFRYGGGRIVVKPLKGAFLLLLCSRAINLQLLAITFNVVARKVERLLTGVDPSVGAEATVPGRAAPIVTAEGVFLEVEAMKQTAATFWEQMHESVAVNRETAVQIGDHFRTGPFKRLKLTNPATGKNRKFSVQMVKRDGEHLYDGKVVMSLAAIEALGVRPGDRLKAEVTVGGGLFGWEGI